MITGMHRLWIERAADGIEALAVFIIVIAMVYGTARYVVEFVRRIEESYENYKLQLARALLLGLELLVAADVIRTVTLEPTLDNVLILGVLVVIRTFLSWSLVVEMKGRWPWQA
jgi:uncharacterized membrane protein